MKVHLYKQQVYESDLDITHGFSQTQICIYIPDRGILGYRNKEKIDFFRSDKEAISKAIDIINGKINKKGYLREDDVPDYIGEVELPNSLVEQVVSSGQKLEGTEKEFQTNAKSLVNLITGAKSFVNLIKR